MVVVLRASDVFAFAGRALLRHRLRSSLSLVGMGIGVSAVVLLTALGEGTRRYVTNQFASLGSNLLVVVPGKNETTGAIPGIGGAPNDLTFDDYRALLRGLPEVMRGTPITTASGTLSHGERSRSLAVIGTNSDFLEVRKLKLARGRFLPASEIDRGMAVAVLGDKAAREMFPAESPLGQIVRVEGWRLRVIGVLARRGTQLGVDVDDIVVVPVATSMRIFNRTSLFRVVLEVRAYADLDATGARATAILTERHGEEDVTVVTQDAVISTLGDLLDTLTLVIAAIASISLLVAGIGIMNVMLVSVSERTGEVGLLKALGVSRGQIVTAFVTEASLLSLVGGVIGVLLGLCGSRLLVLVYPDFPAQAPLWSVAASLSVALFVGVLFGALPARRAARLDPILALSRR